jgi:hypothetical protein
MISSDGQRYLLQNNCHPYGFTLLVKDSGHANFFTNQTLHISTCLSQQARDSPALQICSTYTLISTSTPAGKSSFIKESTV